MELSTPIRATAYASLGMSVEIIYTAVKKLFRERCFALEGHTQLWVAPLYAFAGVFGFEKLHELLRGQHVTLRAAAYGLMILGVEYAGGFIAAKLIGYCPWEYSGFGSVHGFINVTYLPMWGVVGLIGEAVHDFFSSLKVG